MPKKSLVLAATLLAAQAWAEPAPVSSASQSEQAWEEPAFEFDSATLSRGRTGVMRLGALLERNPGFVMTLEGYGDYGNPSGPRGGVGGLRADVVRSLLLKSGAAEHQILGTGPGTGAPPQDRRLSVGLIDGAGRMISNGGIAAALSELEKVSGTDQLMLSMLAEILDTVRKLEPESRLDERRIEALTRHVSNLATPPPPLPLAPAPQNETSATDEREPGPPESRKDVSFNVNAGPTREGNISVSGQARVFLPFKRRYALQTQGEYLHYDGRDEGQFDFGLVNRWGPVQASGFGSFKYVRFNEFEHGGTLGQASFNLDLVDGWGRVGVFASKAFLDGAVVNTRIISHTQWEETYLKVVDQVGFTAAVRAWNNSWFEGNVGALFRERGSTRPGGTLRYVHPVNSNIAVTLEAGWNETLLSGRNSARVVAGLQLGSWMVPPRYPDVEAEDVKRPVPVDVPRIRYEVLKRKVRHGNQPPVADAGGDQIGVAPGLIVLDGSNSFDPDDDKIVSYRWEQIGGEPVDLADPTTERASFTAAANKLYRFRLTVRDELDAVGTDRVTVTGVEACPIQRFSVNPTAVRKGESVTLVWKTEGATEVAISPRLGSVDLSGSSTVIITEATTFQLTAKSPESECNESVAVNLLETPLRILRFRAKPDEIVWGQPTALSWETEGATEVSLAPIGGVEVEVDKKGSMADTPEATTVYRLTAGNGDETVSRTVRVEVTSDAPRILSFVATPQEILPGEFSTLVWEVENADEVSISVIGAVDATGTSDVNPAKTTPYVLTATNEHGEVHQQVIVTVGRPVRILEFKSDKTRVQKPGDPAVLTWRTKNAVRVVITPSVGEKLDPSGSITVHPLGQTTYTLLAYGEDTEISAVLILDVEIPNRAPIAIAEAPWLIVVPPETKVIEGMLDGSKSYDPDGDEITYLWTQVSGPEAVILNPTSPTPTVQFLGRGGGYEFQLTVTDDKGSMGMDSAPVGIDP